MTESKVETPFDKGARILNAVIAEVDLPADLKGNAQSVISMLAELLPRLLAQPVAAPAAAPVAAPTNGSAPDDDADTSRFKDAMAEVMDPATAYAHVGRRSRVKPTTPPATQRHSRPQASAPSAQKPLAPLAEVSEADVKMIWNAYEMVLGLQRNHLEQLSPAIVAALRAHVSPARMVERLISASSGSAQLWKAALDDLAKA